MNYSSIINQLGPTIDLEPTRKDSRATSTLLKDICDEATEKLSKGVVGYGIELKDFAIVDRQFKGEIAATVDKFISRAVRVDFLLYLLYSESRISLCKLVVAHKLIFHLLDK